MENGGKISVISTVTEKELNNDKSIAKRKRSIKNMYNQHYRKLQKVYEWRKCECCGVHYKCTITDKRKICRHVYCRGESKRLIWKRDNAKRNAAKRNCTTKAE